MFCLLCLPFLLFFSVVVFNRQTCCLFNDFFSALVVCVFNVCFFSTALNCLFWLATFIVFFVFLWLWVQNHWAPFADDEHIAILDDHF